MIFRLSLLPNSKIRWWGKIAAYETKAFRPENKVLAIVNSEMTSKNYAANYYGYILILFFGGLAGGILFQKQFPQAFSQKLATSPCSWNPFLPERSF